MLNRRYIKLAEVNLRCIIKIKECIEIQWFGRISYILIESAIRCGFFLMWHLTLYAKILRHSSETFVQDYFMVGKWGWVGGLFLIVFCFVFFYYVAHYICSTRNVIYDQAHSAWKIRITYGIVETYLCGICANPEVKIVKQLITAFLFLQNSNNHEFCDWNIYYVSSKWGEGGEGCLAKLD